MTHIYKAAQVFDGWTLHPGAAVALDGDRIAALYPAGTPLPPDADVTDLGPGLLTPGCVDLQVNGGGGEMVGTQTDLDQIARICAAHQRLGATAILPTLISDTPDVTRQVIAAGIEATQAAIPGFAGLHLEGPHLDPARKGAHRADVLRPMEAADLDLLCHSAQTLPALMVTLAPEAVRNDQIAALRAAGVIVSLGHTNCAAEVAKAAGAQCATHLFNAMSGLSAREPGLIGAALASDMMCGIIADGVHVARESLQIALRMKADDALFLVSDAMAAAGTSADHFLLDNRRILRRDGRLTLENGTLAGADISLPQSVAHLVQLGVPPTRALAMASRIPADVIGASDRGRIQPGARADLLHLTDDFTPLRVCISGRWSAET
ncbi:MAG: N-acetylglucosamine-6-phosphate deacetylase [Roseinatronobacter sp.]